MKLIIAGSRSIKQYTTVRTAIIESGLWKCYGRSIEVVSGKATGVDILGEQFAKKAKLKVHSKPADWDNIEAEGAVIKIGKNGKPYNAIAGHWRNEEMAGMSDEALIIWDGKSTGSLDMLHRMLAMNKPTYLYALRMPVDLYNQLLNTDCVIMFPKGLDLSEN